MTKNNIGVACLLLGLCGVSAVVGKVSDMTKEIRRIKRRLSRLELDATADVIEINMLADKVNEIVDFLNPEDEACEEEKEETE